MNKVLTKLLSIQEVANVPKDLHNDFAGFNYRSAEQILELVKPIAQASKCVITLTDEIISVGNWNYVKATATIYDTESGETHSVSANAREQEAKKGMDTSQITGSTSSYARKYALSGLLALDDNKDADSMDNTKAPTRTERLQQMSPLTHKKGDIVREMYDIGVTRYADQKALIVEILGKELVETEDEADQVLTYITKEKEATK
jgi:hypothetical protein